MGAITKLSTLGAKIWRTGCGVSPLLPAAGWAVHFVELHRNRYFCLFCKLIFHWISCGMADHDATVPSGTVEDPAWLTMSMNPGNHLYAVAHSHERRDNKLCSLLYAKKGHHPCQTCDTWGPWNILMAALLLGKRCKLSPLLDWNDSVHCHSCNIY